MILKIKRKNISMKILVNTPDLSLPGGVAEYLKTLALNQESNIDLFCIHDYTQTNVVKRMIGKYREFYYKAKQYDLIHVHPSFGMKSFVRDAGFILLARMLGKKVIVTMHGWEDSFEEKVKNSFVLNWLFRMTYARVDGYMVLGEIFKNKLKSLGVETDKFFIGTTVSDDSYIENFDINQRLIKKDKFSVLFLSRIEKEKGVYIAIDAFAKLKTSVPIELIVAGDGAELENAKRYVADHEITNVKFVGFVRNEAKHDLLSKSDLLFFPTYYGEGLPTTILEAMLYGLPVVSRINAAIPDVVEHGINGFLSSSIQAEDFVPFLEQLIKNKELYNVMATTNHEKALNNFTKKHVKAKVMEAYEQV